MYHGYVLASMIVWIIALTVWLHFDMRRLASPMLFYLVFHFVTFVFRPWQIAQGLDDWIPWTFGFVPTESDYLFALMLANLGLLSISIGSALGNHKANTNLRPVRSHVYNPRVSMGVGAVILVLGAVSMVVFGNTPFFVGVNYMEAVTPYSTILTIPGFVAFFHYLIPGVFAVWIITRGPRWWYVPLLVSYAVLRIFVGWSRFSFLLGAVLVILAYMEWSKRHWPTRHQVMAGTLVLLAFLSGKEWGRAWFEYGSAAGIETAQSWLRQQFAGMGSDFNTYDMLVGVTRAVPDWLPHTYFRFYLAPFINLVPRAIWSGKPIDLLPSVYINKAMEFSSSATSMVGEAYISFGLMGVVIVMGLVGFTFTYLCARAQLAPRGSVLQLVGIVLPAISLQVFRDGLYSFSYFFLFSFGAGLIIWRVDKMLRPRKAAPSSQVRMNNIQVGRSKVRRT